MAPPAKNRQTKSQAAATATTATNTTEVAAPQVNWWDEKEFSKDAHWKSIQGTADFVGGIPCREISGFLNWSPASDEEVRSAAQDRLFMFVIVKSIERGNATLSTYQPGQHARKKFKPQGGFAEPKQYYRLHFCINLLSQAGEMFYLVEKKSNQDMLWGENVRIYQRQCIYGVPFIMALTQNVGSSMRNGILVIEPFHSIRQARNILLPSIPWNPAPQGPFPMVLHGRTVELVGFALCKSVCHGVYCDRRAKTTETTSCPCYIASGHLDKPPITLMVILRINVDDYMFESVEWMSYGFLRWIMRGGEIPVTLRRDDFVVSEEIKAALINMLAFTNENGGFMVVGWGIQGEMADRNSVDAEYIHSDHYTCHLARVVPMNKTAQFETKLKTLQYSE